MGNILYLFAVVLIIFWAIGYLGYNAGSLVHILLVIAVVAVLLRLIRGDKIAK
ncbi:MAG TPA: lmo0937 family membrane protein [Bacteroidia bacterium]|nr:lmo0937 family membrane protein [Bacteroidia bacterium]